VSGGRESHFSPMEKNKDDVVLYCKSYGRDVLRLRRLLDSIARHNKDKLPVYVSMPRADRALFEEQLAGHACTLIDDETIIAANPKVRPEQTQVPGRLGQMIIKSEFWRLGLCHAYLCIDSDSVFLRDFGRADFVAPDGVAYSVLHQHKELLQLASNRRMRKIGEQFKAEVALSTTILGRTGPAYSFTQSPFLWSSAVWESLDREYLTPRGINLWDAVTETLPEALWYGEALLAYQAIPLRPIEPLFRFYHHSWQYYALRRLGETEAAVAENYLGVIYQSNWQYEMDYGAPKKSLPSRALRSIKRGFRYLQNRWMI
jgi:hypothetical protein